SDCIADSSWIAASLRKGFDFFLEHFFTESGVVKYYHDRIYPIDMHAIAQAMITLVKLRDYRPCAITLARKVCEWGLTHMRTSGGAFTYQRHRFYSNRIQYMRWGQAWMLLSMAALLEAMEDGGQRSAGVPACVRGLRPHSQAR